MAASSDDDALYDLLSAFGPVTIRRMFGGKGIYSDGMIIAIELSAGEILFKADAESAPRFAAAGCRQWTYEGKNAPAVMPYWTVPDSALDDPEELAVWARLAREAAVRAANAKPAKPKVGKSKVDRSKAASRTA
jgi:DNA transformation protein and related proteins